MSYTDIATKFCKYYYEMLDTNFNAIKGVYKAGALITFNGLEILGPDPYLIKLKETLSVFGTKHNVLNYVAQPLDKFILITTHVEKMCNFNKYYFMETFILENINGNYFISNNIVKSL